MWVRVWGRLLEGIWSRGGGLSLIEGWGIGLVDIYGLPGDEILKTWKELAGQCGVWTHLAPDDSQRALNRAARSFGLVARTSTPECASHSRGRTSDATNLAHWLLGTSVSSKAMALSLTTAEAADARRRPQIKCLAINSSIMSQMVQCTMTWETGKNPLIIDLSTPDNH